MPPSGMIRIESRAEGEQKKTVEPSSRPKLGTRKYEERKINKLPKCFFSPQAQLNTLQFVSIMFSY
jgi:hypothetical protein